jgi:hypothetical protein
MNIQELRALINGQIQDPRQHIDANETMVFSRELETILTKTIEYDYPTIMWDRWIPVESGIDQGSESVSWYEFNRLGRADWIANPADDAPAIETFGTPNNTPLKLIADSFNWSIFDVWAAAKIGRSIQPMKARMARDAIERKIEHVMVVGDTTVAIPGFAKSSLITPIDGSSGVYNGDWDAGATTGQMIFDDLNNMYYSVVNASYGTQIPNTILMGRIPFQYAGTKSMTTLDSTDAITKFRAAHPGVAIEMWSELDLADAGNDGPRIVVYNRSPEVVASMVPVRFGTLPPEARNFAFIQNCYAKIGGAVWYKPLGGAYVDNILD